MTWNKDRYANDPEYRERRRKEAAAHRARKIVAYGYTQRRPDPEKRLRRRARMYGLSLQQFKELSARQNHACAICKASDRFLVIDHCHATGKVRGLLCGRCNVGLGYYCDDPQLMRTAMAYLEAARHDVRFRIELRAEPSFKPNYPTFKLRGGEARFTIRAFSSCSPAAAAAERHDLVSA
jgi:Recombination endonuclease VII